jgi:hypothetical protein
MGMQKPKKPSKQFVEIKDFAMNDTINVTTELFKTNEMFRAKDKIYKSKVTSNVSTRPDTSLLS